MHGRVIFRRVSTTYPSETEQTPARDLGAGAPTRVRRLGIIGAGTMGSGIAALAASAGVPVVLLDVPGEGTRPEDRSAPAIRGLERATLISVGNTDEALERLESCDLVIEAIIEQVAPKRELYARLEPLLRP